MSRVGIESYDLDDTLLIPDGMFCADIDALDI